MAFNLYKHAKRLPVKLNSIDDGMKTVILTCLMRRNRDTLATG